MFKKINRFSTCVAMSIAAIAPSTAATLAWTGATDNDFSNADNWNPSQQPAWEDDLTINNAGTVNYSTDAFQAQNGNGDFDAKGTTIISNGTNFVNGGIQWMRVTTGNLVVDNATATKNDASVVMGVFNNDTPTIDLIGSTLNANGGIWMGRGSLATSGIAANLNLGSSSELIATAFNLYDTTPNSFTITFLDAGSSITSTSLGRRENGPSNGGVSAVTWETLWDEQILQFNGASTGNFSDFFSVTGNTITSIPEPSGFLLASFALVPLLRRMRS
jgi:hypothetical protein